MKGRQRSMAIRSGINKQGWQKSDFPVGCEKCYGQNPYVRMLKEDYGQECRICFRPFTVFKWKGDRGIYKRTCVCQSCSKEKNICQVCTLDLEFGLPMQVRDKRCGKNGKFLLDQNFTNFDNIKMKPPPPPGPPPFRPTNNEKQLVYIPQKESDQEQDANKQQHKLVEPEKEEEKQIEKQQNAEDDKIGAEVKQQKQGEDALLKGEPQPQ